MLYSLIKEMFTSHLQGLPRLAGLQRDGSPHWLPEAENSADLFDGFRRQD